MADRTGQQIGKYQLLRLLGEGGFAEVYLGEHIYLGTQAAIKLLHTQLVNNEIDKFRGEARNIARLQHPNIVRVLDFDVEDRTPYLVMDYASKGTLRQWHEKGQAIPLATVVSYVKQIADALQCAHDEKLIHRDVKPENILVGRRNELLLSDFGIALVAQSTRYQGTQDMTGTIAYMSPEQIQGKPRPASDQYSMGVMVYEWLTGEKPFNGGFVEIVAQQMMGTPTPLREKVPTIPANVEQVVMIALEKDYTKRFGSITAFAKALEQASQGNNATSWLPSQPAILDVQKTPSVALPTPEPFTGPVNPVPLSHTEASNKPAGSIIFTHQGHSDKINAVAWATNKQEIVASASKDGTVQVWNMLSGQLIRTYKGHTGAATAIAWSPDSKMIASASGDKTIHVWSVSDGVHLYTCKGHSGGVNSVSWSNGELFVSSSNQDSVVRIWNSRSGDCVFTYNRHTFGVRGVAWSPIGNYIASTAAMTLHIWDTSSRRVVYVYDLPAMPTALSWSPDGNFVTVACENHDICVFSANKRDIYTYKGHKDGVSAIAWSPNSKMIASASSDKTVRIWNIRSGNGSFTYKGSAPLSAVAWSPSGKYIASGGDDKMVQVWVAPS